MEGITVVELSTYIAAPSCGRILATQGARVIKVESPSGDVERKFGPTLFCPANDEENPIYDTLNGGKDALMLDLKKPEDMERFHKLLAKADVFVTNNRIQALKKMGLDYDSLKERYPQLIYAILLGYGEKGPKDVYKRQTIYCCFRTSRIISVYTAWRNCLYHMQIHI